MIHKRPISPINGLQLLRQSEWKFLEAVVSIFRNMKVNGVKFSSKTTIRVTEVITIAELSNNNTHDAFRNLCNLGIIWDAGTVSSVMLYSRFNIRINRLNDLIQAHKNLSWFVNHSSVPILMFGYFIGTASIAKFKEEVYNHTSVISKRNGWDNTLAVVTKTSTEVTVKLTDKGNRLIRALHAFTDLINIWSVEQNDIFENSEIKPPLYDPQQEEFLGITYNTNPKMDSDSKSAWAVVFYADTVSKQYSLRTKTRNGNAYSLRILESQHVPAAFKNVDPENIFSGWIGLDNKAGIWGVVRVKDDIAKTLKAKGYSEVPKGSHRRDVCVVLIKSLGYWVIVQTSQNTEVTLKSIIPILELKLCRKYIVPTTAHIDLLSRKWEFNIDDLELITAISGVTYGLDYFGQMSTLCDRYGIDNLLGCQGSVQRYKSALKRKLSGEVVDDIDEDEEVDY